MLSKFCSKWYFYPISSKIACINASIYDDWCRYLRWLMQVLTMIDASTCDDWCEYLRWLMREPEIANWQNINSQLENCKQPTSARVGCFTGTVIENSFILFSYRHPAKYSSLFTKSPGSPVFIGILRGEEYSGTLHLLFTTLHPSVLADLQSFYLSFASVSVPEGEEWWRVGEEIKTTLHPSECR